MFNKVSYIYLVCYSLENKEWHRERENEREREKEEKREF